MNLFTAPTRAGILPYIHASAHPGRLASTKIIRPYAASQALRRVALRQTGTLSSSPQAAKKSWVEYAPNRLRPYLYLTRIDKPIGTLLLFYPCSMSESPLRHPNGTERRALSRALLSVVDHDGLLRAANAVHDAAHVYQLVWHWRAGYARGGVHNQ